MYSLFIVYTFSCGYLSSNPDPRRMKDRNRALFSLKMDLCKCYTVLCFIKADVAAVLLKYEGFGPS